MIASTEIVVSGGGVGVGGRAAQRAVGASSAPSGRAKGATATAPPQAVEETQAGAILFAITQDGAADFRWRLKDIYKETNSYLERLGRAVSEGRAVDEANNFLRWLQFSGVVGLLEKYSFVDEQFKKLGATCTNLQQACQPHLQGRNIKENPSQARIDELNEKVDWMISQMARPVAPYVQGPLLIEGGQP